MTLIESITLEAADPAVVGEVPTEEYKANYYATNIGPSRGGAANNVADKTRDGADKWCRQMEIAMNPGEEIDSLIAKHPDWRGAKLASLRRTILAVDPEIVETWKWMGSPVWELNGIICVGNIFKNKVKLVFMNGAALSDPDNLFNAELEGNKRRGIDFFETDHTDEGSLKTLVRAAISHNQAG